MDKKIDFPGLSDFAYSKVDPNCLSTTLCSQTLLPFPKSATYASMGFTRKGYLASLFVMHSYGVKI